MKEKVGEVFSIAKDNKAVPGCTISKSVHSGENSIIYFSLAQNTDISAEIFPYHKFILVNEGELEVYGNSFDAKTIKTGESILTLTDTPVGMRTTEGSIYTEIEIRRTDIMNSAINAGEVFKLAELVPYQDDKIVNMDVVHNDKMKFVLMAFDAGTGLTPHRAPGNAIIFALEGKATIGYEGKDYIINAGENFRFEKNGLHSVTADEKFKMALLLVIE